MKTGFSIFLVILFVISISFVSYLNIKTQHKVDQLQQVVDKQLVINAELARVDSVLTDSLSRQNENMHTIIAWIQQLHNITPAKTETK